MLAVALVLRNRAKAGWHSGSIYENAIAKNQIASVSTIGDPNTVHFPDAREPQFQTLLQLLDEVFDDRREDNLTNGALYYCVINESTSEWFKDNILNKPEEHPRTAVLGQTTFFH
jgi:Cell Wall Hydrolase